MTPSLPTAGNPVSSTFNWTPTLADVGASVVTFTAADNCGAQALCSVTVNVTACPSYDLLVEVGYDFGGNIPGGACGTFGNYCADPDTSFVVIKNNGAAPFVGELRLDGVPGCGYSFYGALVVAETSGPGYVLAPGASVTLIGGPEASNFCGYNKVNSACGQIGRAHV